MTLRYCYQAGLVGRQGLWLQVGLVGQQEAGGSGDIAEAWLRIVVTSDRLELERIPLNQAYWDYVVGFRRWIPMKAAKGVMEVWQRDR